jgi:hypothetical protein
MRRLLLALPFLLGSVTAAQAQISIGINFPGVSIAANVPVYPQLVQVPGYPVYYDPRQIQTTFFTTVCTGFMSKTAGTRAAGITAHGNKWTLIACRFLCSEFQFVITANRRYFFANGALNKRRAGVNIGAVNGKAAAAAGTVGIAPVCRAPRHCQSTNASSPAIATRAHKSSSRYARAITTTNRMTMSYANASNSASNRFKIEATVVTEVTEVIEAIRATVMTVVIKVIAVIGVIGVEATSATTATI